MTAEAFVGADSGERFSDARPIGDRLFLARHDLESE
jgi:hypothetical protein